MLGCVGRWTGVSTEQRLHSESSSGARVVLLRLDAKDEWVGCMYDVAPSAGHVHRAMLWDDRPNVHLVRQHP